MDRMAMRDIQSVDVLGMGDWPYGVWRPARVAYRTYVPNTHVGTASAAPPYIGETNGDW